MARRRVGLVAVLLAAVIGGLIPFLHKGTDGTTEFPVYTLAGQRMAAGEEIYRPDDPKPFTYPPFFALPFTPSPTVPMEPPRSPYPFVVWYLINLAAVVWIVRILHRCIASRLPTRNGRIVFWAITAALAGRHVASVFGNQSHDLFVFLPIALGIAAFSRARDLRAGVWAGVAAACKATPLLFAVPFAAGLRVRAVLGLALGSVGATLLPDLLLPRPDGKLWGMAWYETFVSGVRPGGAAGSGPWTAGAFLNQSLSGTLHRLLTPAPADNTNPYVLDVALFDAGAGLRTAITLTASTLVIVALALIARPSATRRCPEGERALVRFGQASAVVCGMVLLSPMSSKSHFCVLLFPLGFCVLQALRTRSTPLIAMLAGVFVIGTLSTKGIVGSQLGNGLLAIGAVTWASALSLAATCWAVLSCRSSEAS